MESSVKKLLVSRVSTLLPHEAFESRCLLLKATLGQRGEKCCCGSWNAFVHRKQIFKYSFKILIYAFERSLFYIKYMLNEVSLSITPIANHDIDQINQHV